MRADEIRKYLFFSAFVTMGYKTGLSGTFSGRVQKAQAGPVFQE